MIVRVLVDTNQYDVEIEDLEARPVVARVEGERFEIWPALPTSPKPEPASPGSEPSKHPARPLPSQIAAPLPGVIVSINVHPGDLVQAGQQICVLEAMKMRNSILAPRDGTIAAVHVHPGLIVRSRQALLDYADG